MWSMVQIFTLVGLYSMIWSVPIFLSGRRRKLKLSPYWCLVIVTFIMELAVVYLSLFGSRAMGFEQIGVYASPILAAALSGWFYTYMAQSFDAKNS